MGKPTKNMFSRNVRDKIRILEDKKHAHIREIREIIDEICKFESEKFKNFKYTSTAPSKDLLHIAYIQRNLNILLWLKSFRYAMLRERIFNKKIIFPLKKSWIEILHKNDFKVNSLMSQLTYFCFLFGILTRDFLEIVKRRKWFRRHEINLNLVPVYVDDFRKEQLSNGEHSKFTLVNWLKINLYQNSNLIIYHENRKLSKTYTSLSKDLITHNSFMSKFTLYEKLCVYKNLLRYLILNFNFYLLYHLPNLWRYFAILRYPNKVLPRDFIFNCSRASNMPLWVHGLVQQKIPVHFIFYALYSEPKFMNGKIPGTEFWRLSTWPSVLCVDQAQEEEIFKDSIVVRNTVRFNNVPWWTDADISLEHINRPFVALFDSFVGNGVLSLAVLDEYGFDKEDIVLKYLRDVIEISLDLGLAICVKFKRNNSFQNSKQEKQFQSMLNNFSKHIYKINPYVSPVKLLQKSIFTVCKPYSTIAKIAQNLKIPVVEYNATLHLINDSFHIKREISRANSKEELFEFAAKVSGNK